MISHILQKNKTIFKCASEFTTMFWIGTPMEINLAWKNDCVDMKIFYMSLLTATCTSLRLLLWYCAVYHANAWADYEPDKICTGPDYVSVHMVMTAFHKLRDGLSNEAETCANAALLQHFLYIRGSTGFMEDNVFTD